MDGRFLFPGKNAIDKIPDFFPHAFLFLGRQKNRFFFAGRKNFNFFGDIQFVDQHGCFFALNLAGKIGSRNFGKGNGDDKAIVLHNHASRSVHTAGNNFGKRPDLFRFSEKMQRRHQAVEPEVQTRAVGKFVLKGVDVFSPLVRVVTGRIFGKLYADN